LRDLRCHREVAEKCFRLGFYAASGNFTTTRSAQFQATCGGTLKSYKFLQARQHKYHTPTFLVCTAQWRLANNFSLPELTAWRPFRAQKSELPNTRPPQLVPILLLVPKLLLHGIPITATAYDIHNAQNLQPPKIQHQPNYRPPPPPQKKISSTTSYSYFGTTG